MKNNIFKIIALSGAVLGCSTVIIANGAILNSSAGISDYGCDLLNTTGDRIELRKLSSEGEVEYSRTYVQYAEYEGDYYLRCATAIKGEGIDSLTYSRGAIVGEDSKEVAAKDIDVSTVYKYLISGENQAYYNGDEIVYEETEETKEYYWACYTLRFETANFYKSNFSIGLNINGVAIDQGRVVNLTTIVSENESAYSQIVTSYDDNYHYYACLEEGFEHLAKQEAHEIVNEIMVNPTLESSGLTEGVSCSGCGYNTQKVLPVLNEEYYDVTSVRKVVNGSVIETSTFVLKDKTIGEFTFTAVTNEFTNYICIGSLYYSIEEFNTKYPNLVASVTGKDLTISVKDETTTSIDNVDGLVNFLNFDSVTITGNGSLSITMNPSLNSSGSPVYSDCIIGISLIVEEGVTLNLTGASNVNKSAIKIYKDLIINGIVNISNFGYGQAINLEDNHDEILTTKIAETGELNISNVKYGIYAWNQAYPKRPSINNYGKLSITNTSSHGICLEGATASFYGRGNSETYISCFGMAIGSFNGLFIGDGDKGKIQNNAKFTAISKGDNVLRSKDNKGGSIEVVFNSANTIHIESTIGTNSKSGIEIAYANILTLFQISCADMTIKGCNKAIGTWKAQKIKAVYNYEEPNAMLKVVNCKTISYSNNATNGVFDCFNANTVAVS